MVNNKLTEQWKHVHANSTIWNFCSKKLTNYTMNETRPEIWNVGRCMWGRVKLNLPRWWFLFLVEYDGSLEHTAVCQCRSSFLAFSIAINQGTGDRPAERALRCYGCVASRQFCWNRSRCAKERVRGRAVRREADQNRGFNPAVGTGTRTTVRWGKLIRVRED